MCRQRCQQLQPIYQHVQLLVLAWSWLIGVAASKLVMLNGKHMPGKQSLGCARKLELVEDSSQRGFFGHLSK